MRLRYLAAIAVTAPTATFTPMKIEIEHEGSCLGATGGTGQLMPRRFTSLSNGRRSVRRVTLNIPLGTTCGDASLSSWSATAAAWPLAMHAQPRAGSGKVRLLCMRIDLERDPVASGVLPLS